MPAAKEAGEQNGSGAPAETQAVEGEAEGGDGDDWVDLETGASRTEDLDAEPQDVFPDADGFSPGVLKDSGWSTLGQGSRASVDEDFKSRSLRGRGEDAQESPHRSAHPRLRRSGPSPDRAPSHRPDRRGRLSARRSRQPRRVARRAAGTRRGNACRDAGLRSLRRVRPRSARVPDAPAQGAGPLRPGDGGHDREHQPTRRSRPRRADAAPPACPTKT